MSFEDYLVNYFRQLGEVLAAVLLRRKKEQYDEALEMINQALSGWLKVDLSKFEKFNPEQIDALLNIASHDLEHEKAICELFYQKFVTFREMNHEKEALVAAQNASYFLKKIETLTKTYSFEHQQKLVELENYIFGAESE